jgi:hypothetical protein
VLSRSGVVKAVLWLLSLAVVITPIVYALNLYGWDIQALVAPSYSPPRVDFRLEPLGVKFENGVLDAALKLSNLGEVEVVFEGLNATAYGPDGKALAPAALGKTVVLPQNSTETLNLKISLDEAALNRLISYLEGRVSVRVEVKGEASMRVFGSKVVAPLSASFKVGSADIGR